MQRNIYNFIKYDAFLCCAVQAETYGQRDGNIFISRAQWIIKTCTELKMFFTGYKVSRNNRTLVYFKSLVKSLV